MLDISKHIANAARFGKFESDSLASYLYDQVMNSDGEDHYPDAVNEEDSEDFTGELGQCFTYFELSVEEAEAFGLGKMEELNGELQSFEGCRDVVFWEDSQGFACTRVFASRDEALKFIYGSD